jgi:hypothetical protein
MVDATAPSGPTIVSLFRAVSHAEYADVMNHGIPRAGPNSYANGKFFAESGSDAIRWGARSSRNGLRIDRGRLVLQVPPTRRREIA